MARTVKNENLQARSARMRLRLRKTHWMSLRPGMLHLGYVRAHKDKPGIWTVRTYLGNAKTLAPGPRTKKAPSPYRIKRLPGVADDYEKANGTTVLDFAQAQDLALAPPKKTEPAGPLTVAQVGAAYVEYLRHEGRERAADEASYRMRLHAGPLAHMQVAALKPENIRGWLADLARKLARGRTDEEVVQRSRSSANRIFNTVRAALNHAFVDGLVSSDAAWRGKVKPLRDAERARQRYLTVEEARRLINASRGPFRDLVQAALHTGCRYGELARLRMHDFNPDSGTVKVAKSKSGQARDVHLNAEGEQFFRRLVAGRPGGAIMLPRPDGRAWHRSDQLWPMRAAVERARIDPPISIHGLRHTYASLSIMGGVPLQVVARNLGHANTRMIEKHYGHLSKSFERDAIRAGAPTFGVEQAMSVTPMRAGRRTRR
jgi:integrase